MVVSSRSQDQEAQQERWCSAVHWTPKSAAALAVAADAAVAAAAVVEAVAETAGAEIFAAADAAAAAAAAAAKQTSWSRDASEDSSPKQTSAFMPCAQPHIEMSRP